MLFICCFSVCITFDQAIFKLNTYSKENNLIVRIRHSKFQQRKILDGAAVLLLMINCPYDQIVKCNLWSEPTHRLFKKFPCLFKNHSSSLPICTLLEVFLFIRLLFCLQLRISWKLNLCCQNKYSKFNNEQHCWFCRSSQSLAMGYIVCLLYTSRCV